MQTDEPELIARSIAGEHDAYAELVNRYKNAVYHHYFAIVRDEDVAEDLAQATFIAAYYHLTKRVSPACFIKMRPVSGASFIRQYQVCAHYLGWLLWEYYYRIY